MLIILIWKQMFWQNKRAKQKRDVLCHYYFKPPVWYCMLSVINNGPYSALSSQGNYNIVSVMLHLVHCVIFQEQKPENDQLFGHLLPSNLDNIWKLIEFFESLILNISNNCWGRGQHVTNWVSRLPCFIKFWNAITWYNKWNVTL